MEWAHYTININDISWKKFHLFFVSITDWKPIYYYPIQSIIKIK